ncbi:MAG TPA: hypothetical protein VLC07_00070 [Solirubrobacterales bacterium]|nr:hypothetical protein [Solirubrobacterales bacterium]
MSTAKAKISALRSRLDETLFRDSPPATPAAQRPAALTVIAGLFGLAILLQMLRVGWSVSLHSLWAEDGVIYLSGAIHSGFGGSLFDTYATYLVFVPRGIAELADLLPLADAPAAMAVLSGAVVALSGLVVWWATAGLIENPYLRGALVALTVLSPVGGLESTDSAAYVPWYMLFASFWVLLWRPRTSGGAIFAGLFVLATGLSTPGVWFFIPLAILRTLATRDRRDAIVLAGYWVGAIVQVPVLIFNEEEAVSPLWTSDIWTAYLQRVLDGAAFGFRLGGEAWIHFGWAFLVALLLAAAAALIWGAMRSNFGARLLAAVAIPISVAMFVVSAYQRAVGSDLMWQPHDAAESAGRYAIVPALLLVSVAFVMLDRRSRRRRSEGRPGWLAIAAAALAAVVIAASFYVGDTEVRGAPPWEAALDAGAETCATEDAGDSGEAAVPTSPPGWGLSVPCDQLP